MQLLKPKLISLVNDDEQHFIVGGPAVPRALRLLRGQERGKLEVIGIVKGDLGRGLGHRGLGHRGLGHRGPFRSRAEYVRAHEQWRTEFTSAKYVM